MSRRRVVITGLGVDHVAGRDRRRAVGEPLRRQERHHADHALGYLQVSRRASAASAPTFDVTKYGVDVREAKRLDRFGQFGLAASVRRSRTPGIDFAKEDRYRCGVLIGSGIGGIETLEEQNKILNERGVGRVSPFTVPRLMANAASGNVSILFELNGPNTRRRHRLRDRLQRDRRRRAGSSSTTWPT